MAIGIYLVKHNKITIGTIVAFNSVAVSLINPIIGIINNISTISILDVYIKRIEDVLISSSETKSKKFICDNKQNNIHKIEFKNVSFSYSKFDEKTLNDLNFSIKKNETVAIVGPSGSGKSTIIKLLEGLFDITEGEIDIVLNDGKKIKTIDLRSVSGNATQNSKLLSGTIYDNLTLNRDIEMEDILSACQTSEILDDILSLPMGFGTMISDDGANFSGGQKQRLIIARALLTNPSILLLDEATSNVDATTERKIYKNLEKFKGIKIIVAHRLSTIRNADKIIYINDGCVESIGTHNELYKRLEGYRDLYGREKLC